MRACLAAILAVTLAAGGGRVSAQEAAAAPGPAAASASVEPRPAAWRGGLALPAELAPPAWQQPGAGIPTLRAADGVVPFFSGLFGAMGGMFVASWWVRRNTVRTAPRRGCTC